MNPRPGTLLETVVASYEAALDPQMWPLVLQQAKGYLRARSAALYLEDSHAKTANFLLTDGSDNRLLGPYAQYYRFQDPNYIARVNRPAGTVTATNLIVADRDLERTEYFADYQRPVGIFYQAGVTLLKEPGRVAFFAVHRPRADAGFTPKDLRKLKSVYPHVRRAFQLARHFSAGGDERIAFGELLQRLPMAIFLLGAKGQVVFLNRHAEALVARRDALLLRDGVLLTHVPSANSALHRLIQAAVATGSGEAVSPGGAQTVYCSAGTPLLLNVTPLRVESVHAWESSTIRAAVLVSEPTRNKPLSADLLCHWFDLTNAEARVAIELANGHTPEDVALRLQLNWHTIRTHQRTIYEKLGVHTQPQLVKALLTSPAAWHRPPGKPDPFSS